jgi:CspA family cold shock protein
MSTKSLSKKLLVSALVALPFPYLLLIASQFAGALPNNLSAASFLGSEQGTGFYVVAWLIFLAAAMIAAVAGESSLSVSGASVTEAEESTQSDGPEGAESGSVKWFNVNKGFGFITTDAGEDVFVHFRSIRGQGRRSLRQGQLVRFDLSDGDKGRQADNVSVIK